MPKKQNQENRNNNGSLPRWLLPLLAGMLILSFALEYYGNICPIASVTGFPCPGCGSSRAAVLLFQGRFTEAMQMHPLIILTLILLLGILLSELYRYIRRKQGKPEKQILPKRVQDIALIFITGLYLGVYIYRMIKLYPHTEPMTYNWNSLWGQIVRLFGKLSGS